MEIGRLVRAASITGVAVFAMAASAIASTITFNTNGAGTAFGGGGLTLNNSLGDVATLTFLPDADITSGVPSNVNLGNFTLVCAACSKQAKGAGSFFDPFTFNLFVTDVTDGAAGRFQGASSSGTVFSNASQISIYWEPLQLGPGINNATSGDFGPTTVTTAVFTGIVAPNSGAVPGQSTVQGFVDSVPEPVTFGLVGGALLCLGMLRRKRPSRQ